VKYHDDTNSYTLGVFKHIDGIFKLMNKVGYPNPIDTILRRREQKICLVKRS